MDLKYFLKLYIGWSWYQEANPIPTSFMADGLAIIPPRSVVEYELYLKTASLVVMSSANGLVGAGFALHGLLFRKEGRKCFI